jgi:hypothetical protein
LGAFEVSEKATNLITGILADNAGWQSITAGDMSGTAKGVVGTGKQLAKTVGTKAVTGVGGLGLSALGLGAKVGLKGAAGVGLGLGYGAYYGGKAVGKGAYYGGKAVGQGAYYVGKAVANKISAWRNSGGKSGVQPEPENKQEDYSPETKTGFENFGSTPVGQQSPKIAAMAAAFDAHNQGKSPKIAAMVAALEMHNAEKSSPTVQQSPKIAAMANAFNEHNLNPDQQTTDPYAAGQAAQTQKPAKRPPKSLHKQQNNT